MSVTFNKPKRNFRKKAERHDSDGENADVIKPINDNSKTSEIVTVAELKSSREKKKKEKFISTTHDTGLLSFAEENEEESDLFLVKKPSYSKKVVKEFKKQAQQEKDDLKQKRVNTQVATAGEYSKDRLKDLHSKQRSGTKLHQDTNGQVSDANRSAQGVTSGDGQESQQNSIRKHDPSKSVLQTGLIPDAHTIHAIRKKRQLAREQGDFISLDEADKTASASRLIRDDDDDVSDDDRRINFVPTSSAVERQNMRDVFLAAEQGSDKEGSDQETEWEEQQIRKGVATQQVHGLVDVLKDRQTYQADSPSNEGSYSSYRSSFLPPTPIAMATDLSKLSLEMMKKNLHARYDSMSTVHRTHTRERDRLDDDLLTTQAEVSTCESATTSLAERYKFFQEIRGYIRDVIACFNEKVPRIDKIESRFKLMQKTRATKLITRRQQDIKDQCQEYSSSGKPFTDPPDPARQQRAADREARRGRRRRLREKKSIVIHNEGLSSDDEENLSEVSKYKADIELLKGEISGIFEDAIEDYYEVSEIRTKFEEWSLRYQSSYSDAYIGLCVPKLINPLVRVQLLMWNPLEDSHSDIEDMGWYRDLAIMGSRVTIHVERTDDNINVIPNIVDKIVLPKISDIATNFWDPMSTTQTCRLVNLTHKLASDYPTIGHTSKYLQTFLKAVVIRIRKALDEDVFMPLYPKSVVENRTNEASVFFNRQFWSCVKLLGNILSWYGILEDSVLQQLALDSLLNRYVLLGVQASPINDDLIKRCQTIVSTLPKSWLQEFERTTMPQLENLCRCLNYIAGIMGNVGYTATDAERRLSRERVKLIIKLLVNINAIDHATNLQEKFAVKL